MPYRPTLQEHVNKYKSYARQMWRADGTIRWLDVALTQFVGWCARQGVTHADEVTKRAVRAY